jgi:hypothetical protein
MSNGLLYHGFDYNIDTYKTGIKYVIKENNSITSFFNGGKFWLEWGDSNIWKLVHKEYGHIRNIYDFLKFFGPTRIYDLYRVIYNTKNDRFVLKTAFHLLCTKDFPMQLPYHMQKALSSVTIGETNLYNINGVL